MASDACPFCRGKQTFLGTPCICTLGTGSVVRRPVVIRTPTRRRWWLRNPVPDYWRPRTREDCASVPRPCPYVGCLYNLYLDQNGRDLKFNFPYLTPDQMPAAWSCVLDVAERGGVTLEEIGDALNVTRERTRQIELVALRKLHRRRKDLPHDDE
jgi:hypothetical protein